MSITFSKKDLLKGVEIVETVVSTHATLPILSNFLFETDNKRIKLSATDLEIGVICYIDAKTVSPGNIAIPAKKFGSIIRELTEKNDIELKIEEKSGHIDINSGRSKFSLIGAAKEDFPALPEFNESKAIDFSANTFKEMVKKVSHAVSTDETRYQLTGLYIIIEAGKLKIVATDGRRLSCITRNCDNNEISAKAIVSIKAISELLRIININEGEEKLKISITENQIGFKIKDVVMVSRLIEGQYPNYEQVIPKKNPVKAKINTDQLLSATKQMALLTEEKSGSVIFHFAKNKLRMNVTTQGIGSGEVDMDVEYSHANLEVSFNPEYLIDILRNANEPEITLEMNGPIDAVLIKPVKDESYINVVMPMRVA